MSQLKLNEIMYHTKKTLFYQILPTKAVEEASIALEIPYQVTSDLIEIRDIHPAPKIDPRNPWQIRKYVTANDIINGKLMLTQQSTFDHVFRYWGLDMCKRVRAGQRLYVIIFDYTDADVRRFQSEDIFFEGGPNDTYYLGWTDVFRSRMMNPGDEVGLFWDDRSKTFAFKLLQRGNRIHID